MVFLSHVSEPGVLNAKSLFISSTEGFWKGLAVHLGWKEVPKTATTGLWTGQAWSKNVFEAPLFYMKLRGFGKTPISCSTSLVTEHTFLEVRKKSILHFCSTWNDWTHSDLWRNGKPWFLRSGVQKTGRPIRYEKCKIQEEESPWELKGSLDQTRQIALEEVGFVKCRPCLRTVYILASLASRKK